MAQKYHSNIRIISMKCKEQQCFIALNDFFSLITKPNRHWVNRLQTGLEQQEKKQEKKEYSDFKVLKPNGRERERVKRSEVFT